VALYDCAKTDEAAAAELRRFRDLETAEEEAFHSLLATRPETKASAIAWVRHVAIAGLRPRKCGPGSRCWLNRGWWRERGALSGREGGLTPPIVFCDLDKSRSKAAKRLGELRRATRP
jgi:hypothetical protein